MRVTCGAVQFESPFDELRARLPCEYSTCEAVRFELPFDELHARLPPTVKKEPEHFFYKLYLLNTATSGKSVNDKVVALIECYNNAADSIFVSHTVLEISSL